jgi:hypothetical protein
MKNLLLFWALFSALHIYAQDKVKDIVILKTGEKIYGRVIEKNQGVSVKIETDNNGVRIMEWGEIDTIKRQDPHEIEWQKQLKRNRRLEEVQAKGFSGQFTPAGYSALGRNEHFTFGRYVAPGSVSFYNLSASFGYQFNPYFILRVGAGGEITKQAKYVPIYGDVTVNFMQGPFTPFIYFCPGYLFAIQNQPEDLQHPYLFSDDLTIDRGVDGGFYLNAGVGLRYMFIRRAGVSVKGGAIYQKDVYGDMVVGGFICAAYEF